MDNEGLESLVNLINRIEVTNENKMQVKEMEELIKQKRYAEIIQILNQLKNDGKIKLKNVVLSDLVHEEKNADQESKKAKRVNNSKSEDGIYPSELHNIELEERYIGLLLDNPKAISMYYIVHEDCYFQSDELLNLYKSILFTEGQAYAPQIAKNDFNFAKESPETYKRKIQLKEKIKKGRFDFEKTYVELRKLFEIRKNYLSNPIKETQQQVIDILQYQLYDQMTIQEVKNAIIQITTTEKFKRAVLSSNITNFLLTGDNSVCL